MRKTVKSDPPTIARVERLAEILCPPYEIALILGVEVEPFETALGGQGNIARAYRKGRERGLEALRRAQLKLAETNATMAVFLGKAYLGQSDRRESEQSAAIDLSHASQRVRDKLAAIAAEADP